MRKLIRWVGGDMPVAGHVMVRVRLGRYHVEMDEGGCGVIRMAIDRHGYHGGLRDYGVYGVGRRL